LIKRRIGQTYAELEIIRNILVESVRNNLSPRQLEVLEERQTTTDPSVQFFGIEWEGVLLNVSVSVSISGYSNRD